MKFTLLPVLILSTLALASPLTSRGDGCNTGPVQCCNTTETAGSATATAILGLLGIVIQDAHVFLGVNCSPITVIGVGMGGSCMGQTICCTDNSHGSLVAIGCVPVSL